MPRRSRAREVALQALHHGIGKGRTFINHGGDVDAGGQAVGCHPPTLIVGGNYDSVITGPDGVQIDKPLQAAAQHNAG